MSTDVILGLIVLFSSLFIYMMAFRFPVFLSMMLSCATYGFFFPKIMAKSVIGSGIVYGLNSTIYAAIMFYFLLGEILNNMGIGDKLVDFLKSLVGHIPGSLSHINILASMVFAGVSGSSTADTASIGSMMIPMMKKEGYTPEYAAAVTEVSSIIGPIIPPSNVFIFCSLVLGCSVRKLFLGGIVPGVLLGLFQLGVSFYLAKKRNFPCSTWQGWRNAWRTFIGGFGAVLLPLFVMVLLVLGIGTVVEIGACSCLLAIIVSIIYKDFTIKTFIKSIVNAGLSAAKILAIISAAGIYQWIISSMGATRAISEFVSGLEVSPTALVAICMLIFFILGMLLDTTVQHLVIMPLMASSLIAAKVDLIWFSVLASLMINIGLNTPPVGNLIYATSAIAGCPAKGVIKESLPFLLVMMVLCVVLLFCPGIVTFLPNTFG